MYGKWLVECMNERGEWVKFNYFTCGLEEIKRKCANVLITTKYYCIKYIFLKE